MKVLHLFPPNYPAIAKAFKVRGKAILFCYGDTIYNPGRIKVPPSLFAHEAVHCQQQGDNPPGWWQRYIADRSYRLAMEIPAHCAECRALVDLGWMPDVAIRTVAERLASPLYGGLLSVGDARHALSGAAHSGSTTTISFGPVSNCASLADLERAKEWLKTAP